MHVQKKNFILIYPLYLSTCSFFAKPVVERYDAAADACFDDSASDACKNALNALLDAGTHVPTEWVSDLTTLLVSFSPLFILNPMIFPFRTHLRHLSPRSSLLSGLSARLYHEQRSLAFKMIRWRQQLQLQFLHHLEKRQEVQLPVSRNL